MSKKEKVQPKDIIGREIKMDDCVAFANGNSLYIGRVFKITPKMVRMKSLKSGCEYLKYHDDTMVLDAKDATYYILTKC